MGNTYVVDGSNLAYDDRKRPSARRLADALVALQTRVEADARLIAVVDANLRHRLPNDEERATLQELLESGVLTTTPPGVRGRGDRFVVQLAEEALARGEDVVLVSDDSYRELQREHPWITDDLRFLRGRLVGGYWSWTSASAVRARDLPDATVTGLGVVGVQGGHQEVYKVQGGQLYHRWFYAGWSDWHEMELPETQVPMTCAAASHGPFVDLFVVSRSNELLHRWWGTDQGWSDWDTWGRATGPVTAASTHEYHVEVFWLDGSTVYHRWYGDWSWSDVHRF